VPVEFPSRSPLTSSLSILFWILLFAPPIWNIGLVSSPLTNNYNMLFPDKSSVVLYTNLSLVTTHSGQSSELLELIQLIKSPVVLIVVSSSTCAPFQSISIAFTTY